MRKRLRQRRPKNGGGEAWTAQCVRVFVHYNASLIHIVTRAYPWADIIFFIKISTFLRGLTEKKGSVKQQTGLQEVSYETYKVNVTYRSLEKINMLLRSYMYKTAHVNLRC